jgi:hypothetical protein
MNINEIHAELRSLTEAFMTDTDPYGKDSPVDGRRFKTLLRMLRKLGVRDLKGMTFPGYQAFPGAIPLIRMEAETYLKANS